MIGHETDGTGSGTLGHRKIITDKVRGNASYDAKKAVESLVSYDDSTQLIQNFTQTVNNANSAFVVHVDSGEGHPNWSNGEAYLDYTNPNSGDWERSHVVW
jgi:hypothetical protein